MQEHRNQQIPMLPFERIAHAEWHWLAIVAAASVTGLIVAWLIRRSRLAPTWTPAYVSPGLISWVIGISPSALMIVTYVAGGVGLIAGSVALHGRDLSAGADLARRARERRGPTWAIRSVATKRFIGSGRARRATGIVLGQSMLTGGAVRLPLTQDQGHHLLVTGSTGSGKTVSLRRIATEAIAEGFSVVIVDAKGGLDFLGDVHHAAVTNGYRFIQWSFKGPWTYNAYGSGSAGEIAARLLFDEITEPYYLRIFQRHLQQVVAAVQAAGLTPSLRLVTRYAQAANWGELIDRLTGDDLHRFAQYVDSLTPRITQDLTGSISRLATLDESDIGRWLAPEGADRVFDLQESMDRGDAVLFRLDADGQPEPTRMFGAALIQDLVSIAGRRQTGAGRPVLIIIDEFPAIAAPLSANLLERGRSANYSVALGVQDLAGIDQGEDTGLTERIVGNLTALLVHRQVVPSSRELIAQVVGTVGAWTRTRQVKAGFGATGLGSLTREREFPLHPDELSSLEPGEAYVIRPGAKRPHDRVRIFRPFFGRIGGGHAD
jgi:hypothetical protein